MKFPPIKTLIKYLTLPVFIVLFILISFLAYMLFKCYFGGTKGQRVSRIMPNLNPPKKMNVFMANSVMDSKKLFLTKKMHKDIFKSVFTDAERPKVKAEAIAFFKKQYGFSDAYLNTFMSELTVNPVAGYMDTNSKQKVVDGGYILMILPNTKLRGLFGGDKGVVLNKMAMLPFGYYRYGDGDGNNMTTIRYFGEVPMVMYNTYYGTYSPIDCTIQMANIGQPPTLSGKAQGIYINRKLKNGLDHVLIKNVLTFH